MVTKSYKITPYLISWQMRFYRYMKRVLMLCEWYRDYFSYRFIIIKFPWLDPTGFSKHSVHLFIVIWCYGMELNFYQIYIICKQLVQGKTAENQSFIEKNHILFHNQTKSYSTICLSKLLWFISFRYISN